jgi:hypothetical protein
MGRPCPGRSSRSPAPRSSPSGPRRRRREAPTSSSTSRWAVTRSLRPGTPSRLSCARTSRSPRVGIRWTSSCPSRRPGEVTVTAEAPIVDTKTSTIDSKFDKDLLEKLPTIRRVPRPRARRRACRRVRAPRRRPSSRAHRLLDATENVFLINGVDAQPARRLLRLSRQRQLRRRRGGAHRGARVEGGAGASPERRSTSSQVWQRDRPLLRSARSPTTSPPRRGPRGALPPRQRGRPLASDIKTDWKPRARWAGRS